MPEEKRRRFILFRVVYELAAEDPLPARQTEGRFHAGEDLKSHTYYLAEEEDTCWAEVNAHKDRPVDPHLYRVFRVEAALSRVVDLTEPAVRKRYRMTRGELEDVLHREPCQALGKLLREQGVQAIRTYSAARKGAVNVVLFAENLDASCELRCQENQEAK